MPHDPAAAEAAAQRQLDAYNARDVAAFAAAYAEDVEVFELPGAARTLAGREALRARYAALFAASPTLHCRLLARVVHAPFVVDHELVTGMQGGAPVHAVAIYQVEARSDGSTLIRRVWFLRPPA
jgi:uncharacterized protein (TIGR02246 family)